MVGILLIIYIKNSISDFIREISSSTVKTGGGGNTGNKGSVCIRFTIYDTSFSFVCVHLASGHNNFEERTKNTKTIFEYLYQDTIYKHVLKNDYV